jgi:hypothetical protein
VPGGSPPQAERAAGTSRCSCIRPLGDGAGFGQNEAYSSRMTMTTNRQGQQQTSTVEASGKWLQADCGSIKPLQPGKR